MAGLFVLLGLCWFMSLSACPIWFASCAMRRVHRQPHAPSGLPRNARLLAGVISYLTLLFTVGVGLVWLSVDVRQFLTDLSPVFLLIATLGLPFLIATLTPGLPVFAFLVWKNRCWSVVGRSHYSAVALASVIVTTSFVSFFVLTLTGNDDAHLVGLHPGQAGQAEPAQDPSGKGTYEVRTFFYGSGTDKNRSEYRAPVAFRTETVDASPFLENWVGKMGARRSKYWGFGRERLPLNGRVWYPAGDGPFPLVLIVHGNHYTREFSDPGYAYLGELLASRGFITVSVDENFLNGQRGLDPLYEEIDARAWMLLQHLRVWRVWDRSEGHPLYRRVDMQNIALIGHSRGGEAIAVAGAFNGLARYPDDAGIAFDFNFSIKSLVAIAPVDGEYRPAGQFTHLENVNYLVLQGSHDSDQKIFAGMRQYHRTKFTDGRRWFKATVYVYRANHSQFNTAWGTRDSRPPLGWFLNQKPLLNGDDQRRIASVYISAFLEVTLRGQEEYMPLFQDHRALAHYLPETIFVTRYQDSSLQMVADYEEDVDVTTATLSGARLVGEGLRLWREGGLVFRDRGRSPENNSAVYLAWGTQTTGPAPRVHAEAGSYCLLLPDSSTGAMHLGPRSRLAFSLAGERKGGGAYTTRYVATEALDFSVELSTDNGVNVQLPLSRFRALAPPLTTRLFKLKILEKRALGQPSELVLQTYELPLQSFTTVNRDLDPTRLARMCFRFDLSPLGTIVLDDIGFIQQ